MVLQRDEKLAKMTYSTKQIAQVASYIKSLNGTNPPNPKEPQGELYKEEAAPVKTGSRLHATTKQRTNKVADELSETSI